MITLEHIKIYKKYNGDGDMFIRCAAQDEKIIMDYKKWNLIDSLIQNLYLIKKGLASDSFIKSTEKELKENCNNKESIQALEEIVE